MKRIAALGLVALTLSFVGTGAFAECYFGSDAVTGMDTIICETESGFSSWGTMIAEA
ncbi:hypothetical protein [Ruegeria sp. 6PALISEP08]|uniref:hypothetical protein n=1 Tax=Ruegeria sp. 6PALISEP08 TaxID=1225660 RepID=UPI000AFFFA98|nr:hypothetical protein [Ruegeria sp. 6PALISEP08]